MLKVLPVLLLLTVPAFAGDYRDSDDYWFYQQDTRRDRLPLSGSRAHLC